MSKGKVISISNVDEEISEFHLSKEHNIYTLKNTIVIAQEKIKLETDAHLQET